MTSKSKPVDSESSSAPASKAKPRAKKATKKATPLKTTKKKAKPAVVIPDEAADADDGVADQNIEQLIKNLSFCVFDLETTGGNHKVDKIIEIGMVRIENLKIVDEINYLIQPEIKIPEFIQKLTSITPKDVENAPTIETIIDQILAVMGDSILVAHNTSFDIPFFNSVLKRLDREPMLNKGLCTNLMTKYLIPNLMNSNLNYMCRIFKIPHKKAHRALDDARATAHLLINYLNIFLYKDIKKINHLYYPRNRYELDRIHIRKDQGQEPIVAKLNKLNTPALLVLKGENGVILFAMPISKEQAGSTVYIEEQLGAHNWEICTIRLYGTFLECLVHFASLYAKIDPKIRSQILKFLSDQYLPKDKGILKPSRDQEAEANTNEKIGDFVILKHLVPEQLIIYPISSIRNGSELIFRYPSHKKKLIQYINSKSSKLANNKIKKAHYPSPLNDFINSYLKYEKIKDKSLLIFDKSLAQKRPEEFFEYIDNFLAKNPNSYQYPREYI